MQTEIKEPLYKGTILSFNNRETSVKEAKRKASLIFNMYQMITPINKFIYTDDKIGTVTFTRINKIFPNGHVIFGEWK